MVDFKFCSSCKEEKPLSEFYSRVKFCKPCSTADRRKAHQKNRLKVLTHYSSGPPTCSTCSESRIEVLDIDHVSGGGSKYRAQNGNSPIHRLLIRLGFPPGYRVLCRNCNWLAYLSRRARCR